MKWIKTAIGAVIAVFTIGIIATTVYKMTRPREVIREVSFEVDAEEGIYYPVSAYNKIVEYGVIDEENKVINIVSAYVDDVKIFDLDSFNITIDLYDDKIWFNGIYDTPDGGLFADNYIDADGNWVVAGGSDLNYNANIKLVFEVTLPPQLTGITATLILLIPMVFVGGVLLYFYKPLKKE